MAAPINIVAADTGESLAVVQAEPHALVASLRRAASDAGGGGAHDKLCGVRMMLGDFVLRDGDSLEDVGLGNGGTVIATKIAALHLWVNNTILWRTIEAPFSGPLGENLKALPLGRDRVIAFPTRPAWRKYRPQLPWVVEEDTGLTDRIGLYTIERMGAADIWVCGADESSNSHTPPDTEGSQVGGGFIGGRRVPLPLGEDENIHYFAFSDGVATILTAPGLAGESMTEPREGMVRKFRLCGIDKDDLAAVRFKSELELSADLALAFLCGLHARMGAGSIVSSIADHIARYILLLSAQPACFPRSFQFQAVDHDCKIAYPSAVDKFDPAAEQQADSGWRWRRTYQQGRDRYGQLIGKLGEWQLSTPQSFEYKVCELGEDGSEGREISSFHVSGHVNHGCQSLGEGLMLFASTHANEDAFYDEMRLLDWTQGGVQVRSIPLQFTPKYMEFEWPRGVIHGSTQTFYTCWPNQDNTKTTFAFATPVGESINAAAR